MTERALVESMFGLLAAADRKSVCAARGFDHQTMHSAPLFVEHFLSKQGLEDVLRSMTIDELASLNVILFCNKWFDIAFFASAYPKAAQLHNWGGYSDRYKPVLKMVKERLVRRGVLIMTVESERFSGRASVLERHQFRFPGEFDRFLPPPFEKVEERAGQGEMRHEQVRSFLTDDTRQTVRVRDGKLLLGDNRFTARLLHGAMIDLWESSLCKFPKESVVLNPVLCAAASLNRLKSGQWVKAGALQSITRMAVRDAAVTAFEDICAAGFDCGCIARYDDGCEYLYGPAFCDVAPDTDPLEYLRLLSDGRCVLDLKAAPFDAIESLAAISYVKRDGKQLTLSPDPATLGKRWRTDKAARWMEWICRESPVFREACNAVMAKEGRAILHKCLSVARVRDLSLKMKIRDGLKGASSHYVELTDEHIAFPIGCLAIVSKIVSKAGFAIKTVSEVNT